MGTVALILGLCGLVCFPLSLVAGVVGAIAWANSDPRSGGRSPAMAGMILAGVAIVGWMVVLLILSVATSG